MSQSSGLSYSRPSTTIPAARADGFPRWRRAPLACRHSKSVPFTAPSYWEIPDCIARAEQNPYFRQSNKQRQALRCGLSPARD